MRVVVSYVFFFVCVFLQKKKTLLFFSFFCIKNPSLSHETLNFLNFPERERETRNENISSHWNKVVVVVVSRE